MCTEYYSAQYKLGRMTANVEITIIKKKMEKRASVCAYNQPKRLAVQHIWFTCQYCLVTIENVMVLHYPTLMTYM